MDSLTQIVLGAAVGETVAGKRLGNRAMMWGAIGGTIPDIDVFATLFFPEVEALALHRGFSHSILFSLTFPFILALATYGLYSSGLYQKKYYKTFVFILSVFVACGFVIMSALLLFKWGSWFRWPLFLLLAGGIVFSLFQLYRNYLQAQLHGVHLSYWRWYVLFFWAIITHALLDCFTTYGTQLYSPFNSLRVAWNSISVIDPLYTLPLMICLIVSAFYAMKSQRRKHWNYLGLGLSTFYLVFTLINKQFINRIAETTIHEEGIVYHRYMTTPTLLNNILWSVTIDSGDTIYTGLYSMWDKEKKFKLHGVPRNLHLRSEVSHKSEFKTLEWFTDEYYTLVYTDHSFIQMNDLRFGTIDGEKPGDKNFVFSFIIKNLPEGKMDFTMVSGRPSENERNQYLQRLFSRIKGI